MQLEQTTEVYRLLGKRIILRLVYKIIYEEQFCKKKALSFTFSFQDCLCIIHNSIQPSIYQLECFYLPLLFSLDGTRRQGVLHKHKESIQSILLELAKSFNLLNGHLDYISLTLSSCRLGQCFLYYLVNIEIVLCPLT